MRTTRWMLSVAAALITLAIGGCAVDPAPASAATAATGPTLYTAVVAADQPLASQAGARILEQGGNAVDAAVAAAFTLSVVRPQSCGIGGGGFMVIHLPASATRDGRAIETVVNAREWCPEGVGPDTFANSIDANASTVGGLAVAVPGSVAGLLSAQQAYGRLDRAAVMQPAIDAATDGFIADAAYMSAAKATIEKFNADPGLRTRFPFLWTTLLHEGRVREGDRITNPAQAATLRLIAREGAGAFYRGPIADAIVKAVRESGGVLNYQDLAEYERSGVRTALPIRAVAFGRTFLTMRPPSSGGVALAQVVGMLDARNAGAMIGTDEAGFDHTLTECFKLAFADRAAYMADPAFRKLPTGRLLSAGDISARAALIDPARTFPPDYYTRAVSPYEPVEDHGTSHVSAVDRWGGACAATETINLTFGSWVCAEPYGFLLNNQMDDFTTRRGEANAFGLRQSDDNLPQPGKRPLSSMTPTIVLDAGGNVVAVAGASGGPRIITATVQTLINALLRGEDAQAAVSRKRLHHQWMPDTLYWEPLAERTENDRLMDSLNAKGHRVQAAKGESAAQLIVRCATDNPAGAPTYSAGCDPRKGGEPAGTVAGKNNGP